MIAYKENLDRMVKRGCQTPGCDHESHDKIYLHGRCHVGGRIAAYYSDGHLTIECMECRKEIAKIAVAGAN